MPIAGHGSRFSDVGYKLPKPLIRAKDKIIVQKSLDSVEHEDCNLIFIVRQEHITKHNIDTVLKEKFGNDIKLISIEKDTLAAKALEIMNTNRITSLCVHNGKRKNITIGVIHIHNILNANIS